MVSFVQRSYVLEAISIATKVSYVGFHSLKVHGPSRVMCVEVEEEGRGGVEKERDEQSVQIPCFIFYAHSVSF